MSEAAECQHNRLGRSFLPIIPFGGNHDTGFPVVSCRSSSVLFHTAHPSSGATHTQLQHARWVRHPGVRRRADWMYSPTPPNLMMFHSALLQWFMRIALLEFMRPTVLDHFV